MNIKSFITFTVMRFAVNERQRSIRLRITVKDDRKSYHKEIKLTVEYEQSTKCTITDKETHPCMSEENGSGKTQQMRKKIEE